MKKQTTIKDSKETEETTTKPVKKTAKAAKTTKATKGSEVEVEVVKEISLTNEVRQLLLEVDTTHRYSMSRIYGLYNRAFDKQETPQSCASCLLRKVRELRRWLIEIETSEEK